MTKNKETVTKRNADTRRTDSGSRAKRLHTLPSLYTVAEVADALKVTPQTVRNLIRRKYLNAWSIGRGATAQIRIDAEDVRRFLMAMRKV